MTNELLSFSFEAEQPQRLDKFLVSCLPELSRTRLQSLVRQGLVWVDGRAAHKAGQMLERPSQVDVEIPPPEPSSLIPEAIPLEILFENADLLVIDKPAGMVVHPAAGHSSGTPVHALLAYTPGLGGVGEQPYEFQQVTATQRPDVIRPGIVHRLDKETSGVLLVAKNDRAHQYLQDQFRLQKVTKIYLALVDGHPPTPSGRIEAAIGRDPGERKRLAIVSPQKGRQAISEYKTLEVFPEHTYLEVHPLTGRTHQIRLHLAFIGCPVAGDRLYGRHNPSLPLGRHFLHARRLTITLPGEKSPRTFEAPLPPELQEVLASLRNLT